jgi:alpha-mannosidase
MRRLELDPIGRDDAIAVLSATLPANDAAVTVRYKTRTGALLRVNGTPAGAFDREHHDVVLPPCNVPRELQFEVELRSLPTNGLPAGPGLWWNLLTALAREEPGAHAELADTASPNGEAAGGDLLVIGHSHLDVAWLWTYEETRRKAARTFAIAADLLERDPSFIFAQSQPQLYAFVEQDEPKIFDRIRELAADGRWDANVAALWVESDCNLPSGESLLRQMLHAYEYCTARLGISANIAWLPDTFGFANTLPQLLAHARIPYFATTKLQWNDTTRFPHPQFVWEGPDGSSVLGALVQSYDGGLNPLRVRTARKRNEPVIAGYGDGGGGVTASMLQDVRKAGRWIRPETWFASLEERRAQLPVHRDELYLEYHRGVYTTHHDIKSANALLERALSEAEELVAWCIAVRASQTLVAPLRERMKDAWEIVLRNQFHDVLPGTSIEPVGQDAVAEFARAGEIVAAVISAAEQMLPRARERASRTRLVAPQQDRETFTFENGHVRARVRSSGAIVELTHVSSGANPCTQANFLATYKDRPKKWEAWNLDDGYQRTMQGARPSNATIDGDALVADFTIGRSPATMRIALAGDEPFLRVELDVDWRERRTIVRVENWLAIDAACVTYGTPHGTIVRSADRTTPEERAKFEVPGQRFALVRDRAGNGIAMLSLDTYGWSGRRLKSGGFILGHSLLRGTTWPDPSADLGKHHFSYAYAPTVHATIAAIERLWQSFVHDRRVRLFTCDDDAILVVACKPAGDGNGVVVRARECNGGARTARLRCGARMTAAAAVDALERPLFVPVEVRDEEIVAAFGPNELRSFRVTFG